MAPPCEIIPIRFYFHCGWAIQVDPTFDSELLYGGETLRMFNPGERREVSLSSMIYRRHDGAPFTAKEVLDTFPPREMSGLRYEHEAGPLAGAALWMQGESDDEPEPCWVLMAIMVCPEAGRLARCTIVCKDEADRDWAVDTWRSITRTPPPVQTGPGAATS
ncbi:hypothetical protein [Sorangium sp. So ce854]|uniref:Uncharacterized protein n=1 Tax=Sorangium cellulosum TaxID=56 RepID=A0A150PC24_SORCE|nr:hypothetical protein BE08_38295 [Sorangium cellulosum]